jgi:hypothetical protein
MLGFWSILAIVIAGVVAITTIVLCCCSLICGSPLCCFGSGLVAGLVGSSWGRPAQRDTVVYHHHGPVVGM